MMMEVVNECSYATSLLLDIVARKRSDEIDFQVFERQAAICKAFAHPTRLRLLDMLGNGERGVSEIQMALNISKANLSQHLAILRAAGIISTRRNGKQVLCSISFPEVKQACTMIKQVLRNRVQGEARLQL
jgi:DNA-binding transcriptional ArsR family regulator